jgi:hypothetical protein
MAKRMASFDVVEAVQSPEVQRIILAGILSIAAVFAGFYGYRWYRRQANVKAQRFFAESYKEYTSALTSSDPHAWQTVENAFKAGYNRSSGTALAPYFLVFESDALAQQGKTQEAIALLDKSLATMGEKSPLYNLFAIKKAAMQLDAGDSAAVMAAVQNLQQLTADKHNIYRDMAMHYLSSFYKAMGDHDKAKELEKELRAFELEGDGATMSPWTRC